jgi:hypothetical protein
MTTMDYDGSTCDTYGSICSLRSGARSSMSSDCDLTSAMDISASSFDLDVIVGNGYSLFKFNDECSGPMDPSCNIPDVHRDGMTSVEWDDDSRSGFNEVRDSKSCILVLQIHEEIVTDFKLYVDVIDMYHTQT